VDPNALAAIERRRGPGMLVFWLLLLVVACAGAVWWVWFRK
jgi:hypothetical protein